MADKQASVDMHLSQGGRGWPASATKVRHWTKTGEQNNFVRPSVRQRWGKEANYESVEANHRRTKKNRTKAHRSNSWWIRKVDVASLNEAARVAAETARGSFGGDSAIRI